MLEDFKKELKSIRIPIEVMEYEATAEKTRQLLNVLAANEKSKRKRQRRQWRKQVYGKSR